MTKNDDSSRKGKPFVMVWIGRFVTIKSVMVAIFSGLIAILLLPGQINNFVAELPSTLEIRLNANQWTGMYSSFPEGVVNMDELDLSSDSDVVLKLIYSEETRDIDGYIYSETFLGRGPLYPSLMLTGAPSILRPNRLRLDVFDVVHGRILFVDKLTIQRDGPEGIITVSSRGSLLHQALRLSPDDHLTEDELDFRSLLDRARDDIRAPDSSVPD